MQLKGQAGRLSYLPTIRRAPPPSNGFLIPPRSTSMHAGKRSGRRPAARGDRESQKQDQPETISDVRALCVARMARGKGCPDPGNQCGAGVSGQTPDFGLAQTGTKTPRNAHVSWSFVPWFTLAVPGFTFRIPFAHRASLANTSDGEIQGPKRAANPAARFQRLSARLRFSQQGAEART